MPSLPKLLSQSGPDVRARALERQAGEHTDPESWGQRQLDGAAAGAGSWALGRDWYLG